MRGSKIGICVDSAIRNTEEHSVYPIIEFYNEKDATDRRECFDKALDNLIKFLAPDIEIGDCLTYGTGDIIWVMMAMEYIPQPIIKFPRKKIPGTRMEFVLLPDLDDNDYLQQCLDKTE